MRVIGVILRVVVFEEKVRALDAIVVSFAGLGAAGPCEGQFFPAGNQHGTDYRQWWQQSSGQRGY